MIRLKKHGDPKDRSACGSGGRMRYRIWRFDANISVDGECDACELDGIAAKMDFVEIYKVHG
jgi:hypothetical protein